MRKRDYYSVRTGKLSPNNEINFDRLKNWFLIVYEKLEKESYFHKYFGFDCTDGIIEGELGSDIDSIFSFNLMREGLYPIRENLPNYSEDDLFDVIEFIHDHCSKGLEGNYHSWGNCGMHYNTFSDEEGQRYFRELLNPVLKDYSTGFEINNKGEILHLSGKGLDLIHDAKIPTRDKENISSKIDSAVLRFRSHKSTTDDRKNAVRDLVDVLEFLKPKAKKYLNKKDDNDLFQIANNFGIRHHNDKQQTNYDKAIWMSWMFYFYLATIHALLRIIEKNESKNN